MTNSVFDVRTAAYSTPGCPLHGCMHWPTSGACFAPNGKHRFALWRLWSEAPPLGFVMFNPSKAGATSNDPSATRTISFAQRDGVFGGVIIGNLRSDVATDPMSLPARSPVADAENYRHLKHLFDVCPVVIAAWGHNAARFGESLPLSLRDRPLYRLGDLTKDGAPRHPLYLKATTPILPWEPQYA